jgi:hypothetical protein
MRRAYLLVPLAAVAMLAAGLIAVKPAASSVEEKKESGKSPTAALLPVAQVVLFSSGVGYFQREGSIDGDQRIDLTFPTQDINDLIKSMTLHDLDGGHIDAVSYESNVPVERTLRSFAVNLTNNPTFDAIVNQARGEKIEVVLQQGATQPGTLTGAIVGVEHKKVQVGKDAVVDVECLNLWCADGLRSVKLSEVQRLRFLNAVMDSEFKKALETLALGHDMQKKAVSIHFAGEGKRRVKVGYVVENPIWKTSYRLVLNKPKDKVANEKQDKPYLQGWAVVENTTDEDWSGVRMALISGRPISFQMNLYDALFLKRPVVEPELFASLRPPAYSGALDTRIEELKALRLAQDRVRSEGGKLGRRKTADAPEEQQKAAFKNHKDAKKEIEEDIFRDLDGKMDLGKSVSSAASASKLGDYFQYAIDHPVTLPRQKSALLPILGKDIEGERVSIFNEGTHAKFPLLGLIFTNTTGVHLTQGPITVYEGGTYAGDARILDLQKGERRLLSYAIDLGTEVQAVPHSDNGRLTAVKIVKGILHTTTKLKDSKTYAIVNRNDGDRVMIVEHPNRTDFHLTTKDKPWETAADFHRFKVRIPAGKTVPFTVSEEKEFGAQTVLTNSDDQSLRIVIQDRVTSPAVKEALAKAIELRGKMAQTQSELQQVERQLRVITEDQDRLRKNLHEMPKEAVAYKRYLKKFDDQETQIEQLQKQQKELQDTEHVRRKEYETFLANLSVE